MNLNTITAIERPTSAEAIVHWRPGLAWLAGGTWLFSEPQVSIDTLIDLEALHWPALTVSPEGLEIAATCTIADLYNFVPPPEWRAGPLFKLCCNSLLASFKIWNAATVGGNICMSLPAGAMISLTASLEGTYTLWPRDGQPREVGSTEFVIDNHANVLAPGELLRSIHLPVSALTRRFAMRRTSLTKLGRSAALIVGTQDEAAGDLVLTITAATPRPVQIRFERYPNATDMRRAIDDHIPYDGFFGDPHGSAAYKRHLTYHFAEQVRHELAQPGARA